MKKLAISVFVLGVLLTPFFWPFNAEAVDKYYSVEASKIAEYIKSKPGRRIVFLYASWCPYCKKAMPDMINLEVQKKGSVIAVSVDENEDQLLAYLKTLDSVPFNVLHQKDAANTSVEQKLGITRRTGVPFYIMLDERGEVYTSGNFYMRDINKFILGQ